MYWWAPDREISDRSDLDRQIVQTHIEYTPEYVAEHFGVPRSNLCAYLRYELKQEEACRTLPFSLVFVISYALVTIWHTPAEWANAVEDSLEFDIRENARFAFSGAAGLKNIEDVSSFSDFWSWMTMGFVPMLWVQEHRLSEPYADLVTEFYGREDPQRGVWMRYNRIVLGVRLAQERHELEVECAALEHLYWDECVGGEKYQLDPETVDAGTTEQRIRWLYIHDDRESVLQQLFELEREGWLDERTEKIEASIPVYNAEFGFHTLISCNFFFSRGGRVWKDIIPASAPEELFVDWYSYAFDSVFIACLVWISVVQVMEIRRVVTDSGWRALWTEYVDLWRVVDWLSVFMGFGIAIAYLANLVYVGRMNEKLGELGLLTESVETDEYRRKGMEYYDCLSVEVSYVFRLRYAIATYPLLIVLRLFKSFGAHPRLALVNNTLALAVVDLTHFFIVSMSVFFTYASAGVVLFGREVPSFTTITRSMITCFRLVLGDFDWEEMRRVGRLDAFCWFLFFSVLLSVLTVNILTAIIISSAFDVMATPTMEDTMWDTVLQLWRRLIATRRGEVVDLGEILAAVEEDEIKTAIKTVAQMHLEPSVRIETSADPEGGSSYRTQLSATLPSEASSEVSEDSAKFWSSRLGSTAVERATVREDSLKSLVPNLQGPQARLLVRNAVLHYAMENRKKSELDDVMRTLSKILRRTEKLDVITKGTLNSAGRACNNWTDVAEAATECYAEMRSAHEDLAGWLPDDPDDVPLHASVLLAPETPRNSVSSKDVLEATSAEDSRPHASGGLMNYVNSVTNRKPANGEPIEFAVSPSVRPSVRPALELVKGGYAHVLEDVEVLLSECRAAGLDPQYDNLRREAAGRVAKIVERDERHAVVRAHIPSVGEVWFSLTSFSGRTDVQGKDKLDDNNYKNDKNSVHGSSEVGVAEKIQELEAELQVGRETVAEALQAVGELHGRLQRTRSEKRHAVDRFHQLRNRAVQLGKENKAQREKFRDGQEELSALSAERNDSFERLKGLVEENQELKLALEVRARRGAISTVQNQPSSSAAHERSNASCGSVVRSERR